MPSGAVVGPTALVHVFPRSSASVELPPCSDTMYATSRPPGRVGWRSDTVSVVPDVATWCSDWTNLDSLPTGAPLALHRNPIRTSTVAPRVVAPRVKMCGTSGAALIDASSISPPNHLAFQCRRERSGRLAAPQGPDHLDDGRRRGFQDVRALVTG